MKNYLLIFVLFLMGCDHSLEQKKEMFQLRGNIFGEVGSLIESDRIGAVSLAREKQGEQRILDDTLFAQLVKDSSGYYMLGKGFTSDCGKTKRETAVEKLIFLLEEEEEKQATELISRLERKIVRESVAPHVSIH